jgi:hypothetical protein
MGIKRVGPEEIREVIADLHLPGSEQPGLDAVRATQQQEPPKPSAALLVPDAAPLDFKSLQRYMPAERRTAKFFSWANWFSSAPGVGTK